MNMSKLILNEQIQQEILGTQTTLNLLQQKWPAEIPLSFERQRIYYSGLTYMFAPAFPSLRLSELQPLNLAACLFASSVFLNDKLMDRDPGVYLSTNSVLQVQAMQFEAYQQLHSIFSPERQLWNRFQRYVVEYAEGCLLEQHFRSGQRSWQDYTEKVALQIVIAKGGIARTTIAALVELAQDDQWLAALTESINHFNIACQLLDDLQDWKEDLQTGLPSLLLARAVPEWPIHFAAERSGQLNELARKIYYEGHASYVLKLALESLKRAREIVADLPELPWHQEVEKFSRYCHSLLQDVNCIIDRNRRRIAEQPKFTLVLPAAKTLGQQVASDGLRYIIQQWQLGFGEAKHTMLFSHKSGFKSEQEYQCGDIFQRALITDVLCDANEVLSGKLDTVINFEINYLLSHRRTFGVGGWSYFPELSELSPDADTLAQAMFALLRSGHSPTLLRDYCEVPLATLLNDNYHADGSFETWIVPATNRTAEQSYEAEWIQKAWGTGADPDVMANLLYALSLYDPTVFADVIERGVSYLENRQAVDGSWTSTWYQGPYYGTYVCLRLFAKVKPNSSTFPSALNFLRTHQLADQGWGLEPQSDPLSTALAMLGLFFGYSPGADEGDLIRVENALSYLQSVQKEDKAWEQCPFIRMEIGRPSGVIQDVLSYGSRTITTALVTKATILWMKWLDSDLNKQPFLRPSLDERESRFARPSFSAKAS
jgi:squalene-hopene/tetraprenyl-beta-curcumene cyclase